MKGRRAQRPSQRSARHNWNPSILGILTSDTTASTAWPARTSRAAAPLGAVTTSWPAWPSRAVSRRLRGGESSTTRTRIDFADLRPRWEHVLCQAARAYNPTICHVSRGGSSRHLGHLYAAGRVLLVRSLCCVWQVFCVVRAPAVRHEYVRTR